MGKHKLAKSLSVYVSDLPNDKCYLYAVRELERLLKRLGMTVDVIKLAEVFHYWIGIEADGLDISFPSKKTAEDAFTIKVGKKNIQLASYSPKGVLNAVYELMEKLGVAFLLPGEDGEWIPDERDITPLTIGETSAEPRFPYRGVFWESVMKEEDYSVEEWLRFYAKLKFNALAHNDIGDLELCDQLGIRLEIGGHGFSKLLPRDLYEEKPELFRLFQPEDFGGKRLADSNLCVTNSKTRKIVKKNFKKKLEESKGAYAIHQWADDLPAGGWCLCPTCRSFSPNDQATMAMRLLAECVEENCQTESGAKTGKERKTLKKGEVTSPRIPVIAYHDTILPGKNIGPAKENFLLYAPRERCYGHALDDSSCPRNRFYMKALRKWKKAFKGIGDSHTFEYYFDQILFRGMYPFIPEVILEDMNVYRENDIETHLSLQVAGPELVPEYNMLCFAWAHWDDKMTSDDFLRILSKKIAGKYAKTWMKYLRERSEVFTKALRMCEYDVEVYMDYRWLPENTSRFGEKMAEIYLEASESLDVAAESLTTAISEEWPERLRTMAKKECARAKFEVAELRVMHFQQDAMNCFGRYYASNDVEMAKEGCQSLKSAIECFETAKERALAFGIPKSSWYVKNINKWLSGEFQRKIDNYQEV